MNGFRHEGDPNGYHTVSFELKYEYVRYAVALCRAETGGRGRTVEYVLALQLTNKLPKKSCVCRGGKRGGRGVQRTQQ